LSFASNLLSLVLASAFYSDDKTYGPEGIDAGGEIVTVKNFSNDPQKKIFKKYFKHQANKIYCLEPELIMSVLKIYD
jgi:hypothetical protein